MEAIQLSDEEGCAGCRFWSEMLAQSAGRGIEAICLEETGPFFGKYTVGSTCCPKWKVGDLGAIDSPGFDGTEYDDEPSGIGPGKPVGKIIDTQIEGALANG